MEGIASPMFTISLQRDTIDIGGNQGLFSIGELPPVINAEALTWTNVRGYPVAQGGLSPPVDAPSEVRSLGYFKPQMLNTEKVYPIAWEIPIDDVFLDGHKLPRSSLSSPNISLSALLDTVG